MTKMSGRRPCLQSNPPDSCQPGRPLRLGASDAQAQPLREQIARFLSARPAVTPQCILRTGRTTSKTDCPIPFCPAVRSPQCILRTGRTTARTDCPIPFCPAGCYASVHPTHRQDNCRNRLPDSCLRGCPFASVHPAHRQDKCENRTARQMPEEPARHLTSPDAQTQQQP